MAPVDVTEPSILSALRVVAHPGLIALCTLLLTSQHLRTATSTGTQSVSPPAQNTRQRSAWRTTLLSIFAVLAASSLGLATYSGVSYAKLSYRVWATERGSTESYKDDGDSTFVTTFRHLMAWLTETPVYRDAVEIVAEKGRRLWWGQQLEIATATWGVYLATEGRRRGIKHLWAYLALAHLASLSFAQNLFSIGVLLAPTSAINEAQSGRSQPRSKPQSWLPHPVFLFAAVIATFGAIAYTPQAVDTPWFGHLALGSRLLTLLPLLFSYSLPTSWGADRSQASRSDASLTSLYRFMATASALLYAGTTIKSLVSNTPRAYYHRHSAYLPFDTERRSAWDRTTIAFGRVLGSTADHPVVAAMGWDVLMSATSLGVWAAVRALGPQDILSSSVPFYRHSSSPVASVIEKEPKRITANVPGTESEPPTPAPRKRGRPRKLTSESKEGPTMAALAADGDAPYQPTPGEANAARGDELLKGQLDWESAALAWGLGTVGGLGCLSAGVLGGDSVFS